VLQEWRKQVAAAGNRLYARSAVVLWLANVAAYVLLKL
jgi:hypothetical protein